MRRGIPMSLATSKPELPATNMLNTYGLRQYFDVITGASEDESRSAKADVVAEALRRLAAIGADVSRPVMVGDRIHDVEGAAAHNVPTIYVEWGYGSPAEQAGHDRYRRDARGTAARCCSADPAPQRYARASVASLARIPIAGRTDAWSGVPRRTRLSAPAAPPPPRTRRATPAPTARSPAAAGTPRAPATRP